MSQDTGVDQTGEAIFDGQRYIIENVFDGKTTVTVRPDTIEDGRVVRGIIGEGGGTVIDMPDVATDEELPLWIVAAAVATVVSGKATEVSDGGEVISVLKMHGVVRSFDSYTAESITPISIVHWWPGRKYYTEGRVPDRLIRSCMRSGNRYMTIAKVEVEGEEFLGISRCMAEDNPQKAFGVNRALGLLQAQLYDGDYDVVTVETCVDAQGKVVSTAVYPFDSRGKRWN